MSESRKNILVALSKLFSDIDTSTYHEYISDICAATEYSLEELSDILYKNVAPVCMPNLLAITSELTDLKEEQLIERMAQLGDNKEPMLKKLFKPKWEIIARIYMGKEWKKVAKLISEKRITTTG